MFSSGHFRWVSQPPALVRTTAWGARHVCRACGTHLSIKYDSQKELWLALGAFDFHHERGFHASPDSSAGRSTSWCSGSSGSGSSLAAAAEGAPRPSVVPDRPKPAGRAAWARRLTARPQAIDLDLDADSPAGEAASASASSAGAPPEASRKRAAPADLPEARAGKVRLPGPGEPGGACFAARSATAETGECSYYHY